MLSAYLGDRPGDSVVFEKYYNSTKMGNIAVGDYFVKDNRSGNYVKRIVRTGEEQQAFIVSFKKQEVVQPVQAEVVSLALYPNPSNGTVNYSFIAREDCVAAISVYNLDGKRIMFKRIKNTKEGYNKGLLRLVEPNGSKLSSGIYFVRLDTGGSTSTTKLIIQ